jgi:hypothetical protein
MSNGNVFAVTAEHAGSIELRRGESQRVVFNVHNISGRPLDGRAGVRLEMPAQRAWYAVQGKTERRFGENEVHQFVVEIAIPEDAQEGRYTFELECVWVDRPDESFGRSEKVLVIVKEPRQMASVGIPTWVWAAVASVVLLVGGMTAWLVLRNGDDLEVPDLVGEPFEAAVAILDSVGLTLGDTVLELRLGQRDPIVLEQDPVAGESVSAGTAVNLSIAHRAEVMPRLLGMSADVAVARLAGLDLTGVQVRQTIRGIGNGTVHAQSPAAGDTIAFDDPVIVTFTVRRVTWEPGGRLDMVLETAPILAHRAAVSRWRIVAPDTTSRR